MNTFTDKKFLNREGLAVLVGQIAALKAQLQNIDASDKAALQAQIDELSISLANEVARAKAIEGDVAVTTTVDDTTGIASYEVAKSLAEQIADEIARAEAAEADLDSKIEAEAERAKGEEDALKARATELESIKPTVSVDFGGTVDGEDHNHQLTIKVALNTDNATVAAESEATVDLADLALDGMVSNTRLIEVTDEMAIATAAPAGKLIVTDADGNTVVEYTKDQYGDTTFVGGHKYLVIEFNTNSAHNGADEKISDIVPVFLDVEDLFTDYKFEATSEDDTYLTISVTNDRAADDNTVEYTIGVGTALQSVIDLVEGNTGRGVAAIDEALEAAEADIAALQAYVGDSDDLEVVDGVDATVTAHLNSAKARLEALEAALGSNTDAAAAKNEDGSLVDADATAFSRIAANEEDLIKWNTYLSTYSGTGEGANYVENPDGGLLTVADVKFIWDTNVGAVVDGVNTDTVLTEDEAGVKYYGTNTPDYVKS